jgi:hypothetical protein
LEILGRDLDGLRVGNTVETMFCLKTHQSSQIAPKPLISATLLQEFYQVAFRKRIYHSLDEPQADLDTWLKEYNQSRPHSGKYCFGKTPMQTFLDSVPLAKEKMLDQTVQTTANMVQMSDQILATTVEPAPVKRYK